MKILSTLSLIVFLASSCTNKDKQENIDGKDIAEEQNEDKFEDTRVEDDSQFAVEAADGGMLEVQLASVALQNSASPQVKEFAQTMISEHGQVNDELKELAATKNYSLPIVMSEKNQKKLNELSEKTGAEFDKAYCNFMIKDHKDDIDRFKKEAEKGNDPDVKAWASGKIPALENHLTMAETLDKAIAER